MSTCQRAYKSGAASTLNLNSQPYTLNNMGFGVEASGFGGVGGGTARAKAVRHEILDKKPRPLHSLVLGFSRQRACRCGGLHTQSPRPESPNPKL